jgi:hypothetical protein
MKSKAHEHLDLLVRKPWLLPAFGWNTKCKFLNYEGGHGVPAL